MSIKIADKIELPLNAITQTFAQIGRKGAGKTYLASMIAEQMLDAHAQVIVIDPIGNWWGLRVGKDGKSKGKEIFIIGGSHKDVSLSVEAGREIARFLVETNISVVLDISEFRKNERKRFVTDFAEEFYHLKKRKPTPVHIFLEESQKFVPQRIQKDEARMLGAWEDIVRLGRNCGIGCSMISQRPQSINKEVFSQVECLCVLQVTGLHERKALEEWVQEAGADRKLIGELPSLKTGEGFIWSPSWLRVFEKVKFKSKETFDASSTPELGKIVKAAEISKMDVEKLKAQMNKVIGQAKQELSDIADYKARVKELERELSKSKVVSKEVKIVDENAVKRAFNQGVSEAKKNYEATVKELTQANSRLLGKLNKISGILEVEPIAESPFKVPVLPEFSDLYSTSVKQPVTTIVKPMKVLTSPDLKSVQEGELVLGKCEKAILSLLYNNSGKAFDKKMVALFVNYSPKSSSYVNAVSKLNSLELIRRTNSGLEITGKGSIEAPLILGEDISLHQEVSIEEWFNKLSRCESLALKLFYKNPGVNFSKENIAEAIEYSVKSSSFVNALSRLNSLGLMVRNSDGTVQLNPKILEELK